MASGDPGSVLAGVERQSTSINTYSGRELDFTAPDPAAICLEDIAWGLAHVCRFGAQALRFYSVAEHAVAVSASVERLGRPDLALAALHHDSHEAYSCDIPAPLKSVIRHCYGPVAAELDAAIAARLKISSVDPADAKFLKSLDRAAFAIEADELLRDWTQPGAPPPPVLTATFRQVVGETLACWDFEQAQRRFSERHYILTG